MIIKMISEFKLTVVHFPRPIPPKPDGLRVDLPLDKKLWKIRTGPLGHWAVAGRGPWAAGLLLTKPLKTWFELFSSQRTVRVIEGLSYRG